MLNDGDLAERGCEPSGNTAGQEALSYELRATPVRLEEEVLVAAEEIGANV